MCIVATSESGHGGRFEPCDTYIKLLSEKSRLEGLCAGLEEGNKLNLERIKRQDAQLVELGAEVDRLASRRDELLKCSEVMTAKVEEYKAENAAVRQERDTYRIVLEAAGYRFIDEMPSKGLDNARAVGETVFRVSEKAILDRDRLARIVEKADALAEVASCYPTSGEDSDLRQTVKAYQEARHAG